jgi:transcription elongation factor GreA
VEKISDKTKKEYNIVGSEESDVLSGKISNLSPLGKELLGKKKGDKFVITTPAGNVDYKIISVE